MISCVCVCFFFFFFFFSFFQILRIKLNFDLFLYQHVLTSASRGWSRRATVLGNFHCRAVLLIWKRVGLGSSVFAVGADWLCLDFIFYRLSFFFSLFLSLVDDHMYKLATRCSLSKFRQKVNMYDNVLILITLFPRRLRWNETWSYTPCYRGCP